MGRDDLIKGVNFEYMLAKFIAFHFPIRKLAAKLSDNKIRLWSYTTHFITSRYLNAFKRIITRKIFNKGDGKKIIRNIENIEQAAEYLIKIQPKISPRYIKLS